MSKSKLVTKLVPKDAPEPIKFTDFAINKFQSKFTFFREIEILENEEDKELQEYKKTRIFTNFLNAGLKGLKLKQIESTKRKFFVQQFWFNGMSHYWTVGEFRPGVYGGNE